LDCSAGYSLVGNAKNFRFWIGLESRNGINYEWQSKNTTESNRFDDWKEGNPNDIGVDTCAFMWSLEWYDTYRSQCKRNDEYFICESRYFFVLNLLNLIAKHKTQINNTQARI
ncbi:hypothetical protein AM593_03479, partial [Mytilus galloprovincialis]